MAISLLHLRIRGGAPPESRIPGPPLIGLSAISNLGAHQARRKGQKLILPAISAHGVVQSVQRRKEVEIQHLVSSLV